MLSAATPHFLAIWRIVVSPPALSHWVTCDAFSVASLRILVPLGARKLGSARYASSLGSARYASSLGR